MWALFHVCVYTAPFFEIRHPSVTHYRSGVFERANKKDRHIDMVLTSPVVLCGDVMVEFFNKPRMMKKVCFYSVSVSVLLILYCLITVYSLDLFIVLIHLFFGPLSVY